MYNIISKGIVASTHFGLSCSAPTINTTLIIHLEFSIFYFSTKHPISKQNLQEVYIPFHGEHATHIMWKCISFLMPLSQSCRPYESLGIFSCVSSGMQLKKIFNAGIRSLTSIIPGTSCLHQSLGHFATLQSLMQLMLSCIFTHESMHSTTCLSMNHYTCTCIDYDPTTAWTISSVGHITVPPYGNSWAYH